MLASALYFTTCFPSPKPPLTPRMLDYYILLRVFMCCFPVLRKMFRIFRHKLEQEEENWQFSEISNSSSIFYPPTVCAARRREAEFLNYANHKYLRPSEATNSNTTIVFCVRLCHSIPKKTIRKHSSEVLASLLAFIGEFEWRSVQISEIS